MDVERYYTTEGTPAFVIVFMAREGEPREFSRLVYPAAPEFERLWVVGEDVVQLTLDI